MRFSLICLSLLSSAVIAAEYTPHQSRLESWQQHQALQAQSPFGAMSWRSIGPSIQGGRVVDIDQAPDQAHTYYVTYASGGIWKTTNNGQSFAPLSDQLPNMIAGALAIDPKNPNVFWLGTGEQNASRSSYSGIGLLKSIDGGKSFQPAGLTGADRISAVLIDPTDSNRITVGVQGALYTEGGMRGVYQTVDGGASWAQTLKMPNGTTGTTDIVRHPTNPNVLYAAIWDKFRTPWNFRESGEGSAIYKSVDAGKSFSRLSAFPSGRKIGRIGLAVSSAKPDWLYASVDNQDALPENLRDLGDSPLSPARLKNMTKDEFLRQDPEQIELFLRGADFPTNLDAATLIEQIKSEQLSLEQLRAKLSDGDSALFNTEIRGLELYRSEDQGQSFSKRHAEPIRNLTFTYGYYFGKLAVAPDNAEQVTLLGMPLAISDDGGKSFSNRLNDSSVHVDYHVWYIDPKNPNLIIAGNDGGADISYDRGQHWQRFDRQAVGQSYAINVDNQTPYNVYTGLQDNGTLKGSSKSKADDLDAWQTIGGGDGMQVQIDPRDNSIYTGYQFGNYRNSAHGEVRPRAPLTDPSLRFNWQTPILLSNHNADVLYMGANKLFRSLDRGKTFDAISGDLTKSRERGNVPFASITSIAESSLQFGLLWAGTDDGQLWVTSDSGNSWRNVSNKLPDYWVSRVESSKVARFRAYVSLNAYRSDNQKAMLYVTEDLGKNWRDISAGLPDMPINVVREDPINPNLLYVGTDRGVFVSLDRGAKWQAFGNNLPNVPVHDLIVHPRDRELVAGTHGRSVWIADVLPLQEFSDTVANKALHAFFADPVDFDRGWKSKPFFWFDRQDDRPSATLSFYAAKAGNGTLQVQSQAGEVLRELPIVAKPGVNQLKWDLLVDADRAVALEAKQVQTKLDKGELKAPINAKETPYANAKHYGWPQFLQPGTYKLVYQLGSASAETSLTINAPEPLKSRKPAATKIRGRDKHP